MSGRRNVIVFPDPVVAHTPVSTGHRLPRAWAPTRRRVQYRTTPSQQLRHSHILIAPYATSVPDTP
eukprot:2540099-Rhodomonas_salina.2